MTLEMFYCLKRNFWQVVHTRCNKKNYPLPLPPLPVPKKSFFFLNSENKRFIPNRFIKLKSVFGKQILNILGSVPPKVCKHIKLNLWFIEIESRGKHQVESALLLLGRKLENLANSWKCVWRPQVKRKYQYPFFKRTMRRKPACLY